MNAFTRPTGAHLRLQHLGAEDHASKPYDAAALRLINALDAIAPKARPQVCGTLDDRIDEAERMVEAAGQFREALSTFLIRWFGEADGWIGALSTREDADFTREPLECFDVVVDAWESFAAENRSRHQSEAAE